ncbi:MAG: CHAD domain-containing protein [Bacteroidetes bacterium]|nr:MAG: CHAD domain-containing protein [Bacteroidota bacterium]
MAFFLLASEPLPDGLRRIAREETEKALSLLESDQDLHFVVHETRKSMKKLRAIIRLVRDQVGQNTYRSENIRYRDLARRISGLRDLGAIQETWTVLEGRTRSKVLNTLIQKGKTEVQARLDAAAAAGNKEIATHISEAAVILRSALAKLETLDLGADRFKTIAPSLRRVYHRGYRGLKLARRMPTTEYLHQWRKRVKYLLYQMEILQPSWPELMTPWALALQQLSQLLGTDHDLAVLSETIEAGGLLNGRQQGKAQLLRLVDSYREELMAEILPLGHHLYALPPKAFPKMIGKWYHTWRQYPDT